MFVRKIQVEYSTPASPPQAVPIKWLDNFCMRNFTNRAIYDDTLPVGDGRLEIGYRVPLIELQIDMADWFRRKGYLAIGASLSLIEQDSTRTISL